MAVDDAREFPLLFWRNLRNCGLRQNFPYAIFRTPVPGAASLALPCFA